MARSGAGGLTHYFVELFKARMGIPAPRVQRRCAATAALVRVKIDFAFANMTDALPQIEAGTVRGLAVTSLESAARPSWICPRCMRRSCPNSSWKLGTGSSLLPKTPEPIIRKMSEILIKIAADPEVIEAMPKAGASMVKSTPDQFHA